MKSRFFLSVVGLVLFLAAWEIAVRSGLLPRTLVPAPSAVPQAFVSELRNGFWVSSVLASLNHYALGLLFGSVG
ncbi:MAG: ABC transporter permease, partial [Janthinobacterium lividum]